MTKLDEFLKDLGLTDEDREKVNKQLKEMFPPGITLVAMTVEKDVDRGPYMSAFELANQRLQVLYSAVATDFEIAMRITNMEDREQEAHMAMHRILMYLRNCADELAHMMPCLTNDQTKH